MLAPLAASTAWGIFRGQSPSGRILRDDRGVHMCEELLTAFLRRHTPHINAHVSPNTTRATVERPLIVGLLWDRERVLDR